MAALDYDQLRRCHGDLSLLFIAHRREILDQSLATYRAVLRRGDFGEIHGSGRIATGRHVFAMIQSLGDERLSELDPQAFDVVVVDEFHHAAAASYDRVLTRLQPRELLGLTATPERLDGQDVTEWFDNRVAVELRLWEAIDEGFLVPFQYFGVADDTGLSQLTWRRGGYVASELSNVYSHDDLRVAKVLGAVRRIVLDPGRMRALGFCVSKEHAHHMARMFSQAGVPSVALTGDDPPEARSAALDRLRRGDGVRCIFSVEVLGEGVDVPEVDTILLLRPTQSATVFTQQIGRGLRRADKKASLTVIDLIGQQHREFRFDERLRAILDPRHGPMADQVAGGFPFLPAGCTIDLDRQSEEIILANLRARTLRSRWATLVRNLASAEDDLSLLGFLKAFGHRVEDIYKNGHSWTELKRAAGRSRPAAGDRVLEAQALKALGRVTHIDDPERVSFYTDTLSQPRAPRLDAVNERHRRLLTMLAWDLGAAASRRESLQTYYDALWTAPAVREDLVELLVALDAGATTLARPSCLDSDVPLVLHARYSRTDVLAALGLGGGITPPPSREGLVGTPDGGYDAFFVDLQKSERDYSPTTMYRDYAINRSSSTGSHSRPRRRGSRGSGAGSSTVSGEARSCCSSATRSGVHSERARSPSLVRSPMSTTEVSGERPVSFRWRLPVPMPESLFEVARSVAAA